MKIPAILHSSSSWETPTWLFEVRVYPGVNEGWSIWAGCMVKAEEKRVTVYHEWFKPQDFEGDLERAMAVAKVWCVEMMKKMGQELEVFL